MAATATGLGVDLDQHIEEERMTPEVGLTYLMLRERVVEGLQAQGCTCGTNWRQSKDPERVAYLITCARCGKSVSLDWVAVAEAERNYGMEGT